MAECKNRHWCHLAETRLAVPLQRQGSSLLSVVSEGEMNDAGCCYTCMRSMMLADADEGAHTCMLFLRTCLAACAIAILFIAMLAADLFAGSSALMKAVAAGEEGGADSTHAACKFNDKPVSTSIAPPTAPHARTHHKSHNKWQTLRRRHTRASAVSACAYAFMLVSDVVTTKKQKIGSISI